jgi:pimeloyl-ACP methyl ester carboxylesterase
MTFRVLTGNRAPGSPTYVLVHGIGTSHRYLARLDRELSRSADVVMVDLPGFGGLPKPDIAPSVTEMAVALGDVLDGLDMLDVVLIGHSMGAQWVVETGILRPDLVSAVVVIGPVADDRHRTLRAQSTALALDVLGETPLANVVVFVDYLLCGPSWFLRECRHMLAYAIEDRIPDLAVPLLVLRGGNDPIAGIDWCRRLRDRARFGSLVIVPGHRHNAQFTAPRAVAGAIREFVARRVSG